METPEFLITEFVHGETLSKFLQRYPRGMPLGLVRRILRIWSRRSKKSILPGTFAGSYVRPTSSSSRTAPPVSQLSMCRRFSAANR